MSDLKPCPFCGSTDVHTSPNGENYAYVYCNTCGAEGPTNDIGSVAMTWNRRAQPAQAGQVLTLDEVREAVHEAGLDWHNGWTIGDDAENRYLNLCRAIEQAVLAKRVPMTEAQMLAAFAVAHPQDHADMQDGSPANAVERIGARNVYRRFERGVRAAEKFHGIVGEKGGA